MAVPIRKWGTRVASSLYAQIVSVVTSSLVRTVPVATTLLVPTLGAQVPEAVTHAASTITPAEVAGHLGALAADSLRGRDITGRKLELTAQYVAAQFQRLGLQPGVPVGPERSWFQRHPLPGQRRVNYEKSTLVFLAHLERRGKNVADESGTPVMKFVEVNFATTAYFAPEVGRQIVASKPVNLLTVPDWLSLGKLLVVVAGRQTVESVRRAAEEVRDRTVLYIPAAGADSAVRRQIINELYAVSRGVVIASGTDSIDFAAAHAAHQQPVAMADDHLLEAAGPRRWPWAVSIWAGIIQDFLGAAGLDLMQLRAETRPVVRALPSTAVWFRISGQAAAADLVTAPNVVGMLEGSDTALQGEYVVISARMDNAGLGLGLADSMSSGADDNTSQVAGLLAVAKAFRQTGVRPRRSVVFLATSGGVKDFWGANYFVHNPTTPRANNSDIVANLNLDLPGRSAGDSLWIDGLQDVEMTPPPARIAKAHPELGLLVVDGGTVARPRSGHFPFVQAGVPSLYVHTGRPEGPVPSALTSAEYVVSVARLIFYVGWEMAVADRRPRWSVEGRQHLQSALVP